MGVVGHPVRSLSYRLRWWDCSGKKDDCRWKTGLDMMPDGRSDLHRIFGEDQGDRPLARKRGALAAQLGQ